jgi:hypothetical protein
MIDWNLSADWSIWGSLQAKTLTGAANARYGWRFPW